MFYGPSEKIGEKFPHSGHCRGREGKVKIPIACPMTRRVLWFISVRRKEW